MVNQQIQWGMIGCGRVTEKKSAPSFNKIKGSQLVAVASRTAKKAEDYARRHGVPSWHMDPQEVISDPEVDIVYIATPPGSHKQYALECIEAGKPVYIEKPMARSFAECQAIREAAGEEGVPVYIAYYRRSLDYFNHVKKIVDEGTLGKILHVNMQQYFPARKEDHNPSNLPWRVVSEVSGGGYFHDLGSHALDILFYLFGDPVKVTGTATNHGGLYEAHDTIGALITLPGDVPATCSWSFVTPEPYRKDLVEVTGERGKLKFSVYSFKPVTLITGEKEESFTADPPEHIQMPLIQTIVDEINGKGVCPSTGKTATVTSLAMDRITGIL
ncbi:MAG: Gfo/Idh/MocA family oxidoreductase [Bacteroidota bacterium]